MKRLLIITGSSRGIGKSIALEFNRVFRRDCVFLLMARDLENLNAVKNQIIFESEARNQVNITQIDFASQYQVSDYFSLLKNTFPDFENENFN